MLCTKTLNIQEANSSEYEKNVTVYFDDDIIPTASIIYFHGGGLLYGDREDLPLLHQKMLTQRGYILLAFDYPLAPAVKLDVILGDVMDSIHHHREILRQEELPILPYFLWGRSAGAYLTLLAGASENLPEGLAGIISFYGYGFLTDGWYDTPSNYYRTLPPVPESCLQGIPSEPHCFGPLESHYSVYVYARQQGKWKELLYSGREKFFFIDYSLRLKDSLQAPLFCCHSTGDTDVPFQEFNTLAAKYHPAKYIAAAGEHDFDRDTESPFAKEVLEAMIDFMEKHL